MKTLVKVDQCIIETSFWRSYKELLVICFYFLYELFNRYKYERQSYIKYLSHLFGELDMVVSSPLN